MTQVLPTLEPFTQGTPKFDITRLFDYVRAAPSSTDGIYGLGGTGFAITAWSYLASLYSGWSAQGFIGLGGNPAPAVNTVASSGGTRLPTLWIPRSVAPAADVDLEVSWQEQSQDSAQLHSAAGARRTLVGVAARLANATVVSSGTADTHHVGGDGYFFGWCFDSSLAVGGGKYVLWRVNSGVVTRLADTPTGATTSVGWVASAPWAPRQVRMVVTGSGATVTIACYVYFGVTRPIVDTPLLTFADTSGSRLTAAGRVGFFSSGEDRVGSVWAAPCVNYFQAAPSPGDVVLRDEWGRYNLSASALYPGGSNAAFSGRDLGSGWFGDALSASGAGTLVVDDGNDRVRIAAGSAGTHTRQRPADDPVSQSREVVVRFASSGSALGTRAAGPAVRVSHPASVGLTAQASYDLVLEYNDLNSTARFAIYRTVFSTRVLVAELADAFTTDADRLLALSVQANLAGSAVLRAYESGVQLALVAPASPLPGISLDTFGTVIDATSARVQSGAAEGFYAAVPAGVGRALYVDSFDDAGLVTTVLTEDDLEGIVMPTESAGATGTLALPEGWPVQEISAVGVVRHELDLGNRYASLADATLARAWTVSIPAWTDAEKATFEAFVAAHRGPQVPFSWTPPGELTASTVRFRALQVGLGLASSGGNAWVGSFELEELVA